MPLIDSWNRIISVNSVSRTMHGSEHFYYCIWSIQMNYSCTRVQSRHGNNTIVLLQNRTRIMLSMKYNVRFFGASYIIDFIDPVAVVASQHTQRIRPTVAAYPRWNILFSIIYQIFHLIYAWKFCKYIFTSKMRRTRVTCRYTTILRSTTNVAVVYK